jgi:hypothetical protein
MAAVALPSDGVSTNRTASRNREYLALAGLAADR